MDLAQRLTEGVQALRDGRPQEAVDLLQVVADDPELAQAADLRDIYARVCSLYAQALLQSGRAAAARHPLRHALDALQALGDETGVAEVAALQSQIAEAISSDFQDQAKRRSLSKVAKQDTDALLATASSDEARLAILVRTATAAAAVGDHAQARDLARRAESLATERSDTRHYVLSKLVLAESEPGLASLHLEAARQCADEADEFNLVGAVAKAAAQAGIELSAIEHPG